jgi:hypothetical protein
MVRLGEDILVGRQEEFKCMALIVHCYFDVCWN